jgi:UDP-glucose 4-epimerase
MTAGQPTVIFGDGSSSRDYIYVDDVVTALVACTDASTDGCVFNVGSGRETGIRELHTLLAAACEVADDPEFRPPRTGELQHIVLDSRALQNATGWSPRTGLEDGLSHTVRWIAGSSSDLARG